MTKYIVEHLKKHKISSCTLYFEDGLKVKVDITELEEEHCGGKK